MTTASSHGALALGPVGPDGAQCAGGQGWRGGEVGQENPRCSAGGRRLLGAHQVERYVGPLVAHVTHVLCFSLLLSHPVLRTHNLTVLPSHNSTFVRTNDSAYSNLSATVGEHVYPPVLYSVTWGSARSLEAGSAGLCRKALCLGGRSGLQPETRGAGKKHFTLGPDVVPLPDRKALKMLVSVSNQGLPSQLLVFRPRQTRVTF